MDKPSGFYTMRVVETEAITPSVRQVIFEPEEEGEFPEPEAGQFLTVDIVKPVDGSKTKRTYSLASGPEERYLRFCVKGVPDGQGSGFIHSLEPGDRFYASKPRGKFRYHEEPDAKAIYFIATGTGIAPLRAMIHRHFNLGDRQQVRIILGVRGEDEILYRDEWENLRETKEDFNYAFAISRPEKVTPFYPGRVTDICRQMKFPLDSRFYLCGNGNMIQEVIGILTEKGVERDHIYTESFYT